MMNRRAFVLGMGAIVSAGLLPACTTESTDDEVASAEQDADASNDADDRADEVEAGDDHEDSAFEDIESFEVSQLDLETLTAEIPDETLDAEAWASTWVGEVTDDLFVGIRILESNGDEPREITAYLCDDDLWLLMSGEMEDDHATLSADDAEIELTLVDDEVMGTVTLAGQDPIEFEAYNATGDAGVYIAGTEIEDVEVTARWIVQEDGRQRGVAICCEWPPSGGGPPICRHCSRLH